MTGTIRFNPKFRNRAYITADGLKLDILIEGNAHMNRALDSDVVAVQLVEPSTWKKLESA